MYQTILFDLDGTLLNTIGDLAAAGNHVCRLRGWPEYPEADFRAMVGHGLTNLALRFSPEDARDPASIARTLADFSAYYGAHSRDRTVPYPGIPELLHHLRDRGLRLAVCSNKDDPFSRDLMEHYFPGLFALVRGKREGVPVKPDPAIVHGILSELGADPKEALFVGDSATDVRTGHNAHLPVCGVSWGFRPRETLAEAEYLADTAAQLEEIILTRG